MEVNGSTDNSVTDKMEIDEDKNDQFTEEKEDDKEVLMTHEQLLDYMMLLLDKYKTNPETNILVSMKNELCEQENKIKEKIEEAEKMQKFFNLLMRDQEKYFRHVGALPKLQTWDVGVYVDIPPDMLSMTSSSTDIPELNKDRLIPNASTTPNPAQTTKASVANNDVLKKTPDLTKGKNLSKTSVEVIDLTDEEDCNKTPQASASKGVSLKAQPVASNLPETSTNDKGFILKHPAPLPLKPYLPLNKNLRNPPPKPTLRISAEKHGIVLQWNLTIIQYHATIKSYEIYGYQESKTGPINSSLWKKIGDVKALVLPMACTLTQFVEGFKYHFAIRAVDEYLRPGHYSDPASIIFLPNSTNSKGPAKT